MLEWIPLQQLACGERAEVAALRGKSDFVSRLYEIGLHVGASLQMVQSGHTCVVRVCGTKLCLRPSQRIQVMVRRR
jgi:Fe2+ transport system protein FeoA